MEQVELGGRVGKEYSVWRGHRGQEAQEARRRFLWLQLWERWSVRPDKSYMGHMGRGPKRSLTLIL